jgi:murein DD-endopeptidase MepM/ murein hydrolase activator NlpD
VAFALFAAIAAANPIEDCARYFRMAFVHVDPPVPVDRWYLPFLTSDRHDLATVNVLSVFGAPRDSYVRGHRHSGIDMVPKKHEGYVYVYPIAHGIVCSIHLPHPHQTVVVKHKTDQGKIYYSCYKHLREYYVTNAQVVTPETKLARLYTRKEAVEGQGGRFDHLHLEIRKRFDDAGCASWLSMSEEDLDLRCYDPLAFLKEHLSKK